LDVRFDVEGEGDEAVFARLFAEHMKQWNREEEERKTREQRTSADRSLGDRRGKGKR
jgi:hypothetical protein